ncbi:B-cell receptor-associated protein 31 [Clupea harengus]|uniref:Endoplasmic reticulum transmembrane protein n=1 Tax=Clupea harengus TaxID=7950 RepID=A0A6P8EZP6_CLUHA|nr:B-cell receptor-associated protein 31 [Clupea harengus]
MPSLTFKHLYIFSSNTYILYTHAPTHPHRHEELQTTAVCNHTHSCVLSQKLRDAGLEIPEVGAKPGVSVQEENKTLKEEVKKLKDELDGNKKALQKSDSDVKAMKQQAENLTIEYDRLLEEHGKLQASNDCQDKKSN